MQPAYINEPGVAKMERTFARRRRALAKTLLPCPKCGEVPEIDFGFLDAPYPPGEEFISCPAVYEVDGQTMSCGVTSIGAQHWNFRRGAA